MSTFLIAQWTDYIDHLTFGKNDEMLIERRIAEPNLSTVAPGFGLANRILEKVGLMPAIATVG